MSSKILSTFVSVLVFVAAAAAFSQIRPQDFLRRDEPAVTYAETESAEASASFTGKPAGPDIPCVGGAEEFMAQYPFNSFTAQPVSAIPTGVYELARWKRGAYVAGHRTQNNPTVTTSALWAMTGYNQYYIIEFPDGTYALALLEQNVAAKLKKGESVTLPISTRAGVEFAAKPHLQNICAEYGADLDNLVYTFDDAWYAENGGKLALIRVGIAVVLLVAAAVLWALLDSLCERVFRKNENGGTNEK